jgi:hypothetical protein
VADFSAGPLRAIFYAGTPPGHGQQQLPQQQIAPSTPAIPSWNAHPDPITQEDLEEVERQLEQMDLRGRELFLDELLLSDPELREQLIASGKLIPQPEPREGSDKG